MARPRRIGAVHGADDPRRGTHGALWINRAGGAYGDTYGAGSSG